MSAGVPPEELGGPGALMPNDPDRLGRFVLRRRLRAGGMGVAYLAESDSGSPAVVKTLRTDRAASAAYRSKFRREILAASSVRSSFTAQVLASDLEAERQWVAIDFVPGPTLDRLVGQVGPLRGPHLTALALALAEGLAQLHALRLVHRDLKPSNIICADDGPRLIDFGIAEFEHDDLLTVAELGQLGSPGWIAPERLAGPSRPAASEDMYAWGCVCWYAATGQQPSSEVPLSGGDVDRRYLPGGWVDLVVAALSRDPRERPSASSVVSRLRNLDPTVPVAEQVTQAWTDDGPTERFRTRAQDPDDRSAEAGHPDNARFPLPRWAVVGLLVPALLLIAGAALAVLDTRGREAPVAKGTAPPVTSSVTSPAAEATATSTRAAPERPSPARSPRPRPTHTLTATVTARPSPSTPPTTTATSCLVSDVGLIPGSRHTLSISDRRLYSDQVLAVQDALNTLGYGCLAEDGHFGPATEAAVRAFQRDHALFITGAVDPQVYQGLMTLNQVGADGCLEPFC